MASEVQDTASARERAPGGERTALPAEQPAMRTIVTPVDTSYSGDVHGGWLLAQADTGGSIPVTRRARGLVATVAMNSFNFRAPVMLGDLVSVYSRIVRIGCTSITVEVGIYAERSPDFADCVLAADAVITYVAVGPDRVPRKVPAE